ncbi:MAG: GNAT family N-acetyltransferase, partial [Myxococcota bacterium]
IVRCLPWPHHGIRAAIVDHAMVSRRPTAPHYYLFAVGVLPEGRGKGLASALIRAGLDLADRDGVGAYLENSNPRNTPLYERFGFVAGTPFHANRGCPPLLPMWRPGPTA